MSQKHSYPVEIVGRKAPLLSGIRPLPQLATPVVGEALPAWMRRFAEPIDMSPRKLLLPQESLSRSGGWWRHPPADLLERLAARTGTRLSTVQSMTFWEWRAEPSADGISRRFARDRVRTLRTADRPMHRFGICGPCLASDREPYLRKEWTLGWYALCGKHHFVLATGCKRCNVDFSIGSLSDSRKLDIGFCSRCQSMGWDEPAQPAHPLAVRLQEVLLTSRAADVFEWPPFPRIKWATAVQLLDFVLWLVHRGPREVSKRRLERIAGEIDMTEDVRGTCHDGLALAASLLLDWPLRVERLCKPTGWTLEELFQEWSLVYPAVTRELGILLHQMTY